MQDRNDWVGPARHDIVLEPSQSARIAPSHATIEGINMLKLSTIVTISALALTVASTSHPAFARNNGGAVAAGVVGGLAVGAIVGSQANRNYYGGPGYYESAYQPGYQSCHTERQRFADQYGRIHVQRVRVCD